jgi:hypothetical protein
VTPAEAAALLDTDARRIRAWLRRQRGRAPAAGWTIDTATFNDLREAFAVEQHGRTTASSRTPHVRDEIYVVDLCDELFGLRASRQHRFEWLVGDPARDGRARQLPVDAYYEELDLVVEYRELQHDQPVKFFDKADRMTIRASTAASNAASTTSDATTSSLDTDSTCGSCHPRTSGVTGVAASAPEITTATSICSAAPGGRTSRITCSARTAVPSVHQVRGASGRSQPGELPEG